MRLFHRRPPREAMARLAERRLMLARTRLARSGATPGPVTLAYLAELERVVALLSDPSVDDAIACEHLNHALALRPGSHRREVFHLAPERPAPAAVRTGSAAARV